MFKLAAFAIAGALITTPDPPSSTVPTHAAAKASRTVRQAALRRFEQNQGQFPKAVRFVSRTPRGTLVLGEQDAALQLSGATVRMTWTRMSGTVRGTSPLPGVQHYLVGDRAHWRRGVPGFGRVRYDGVARGIDLEFYGADDGFEYDIVVHPGAELADFSLRFDGVTKIEEDASGELVLSTAAGAVRQRRPIAFQDVGGHRMPVAVRHEIHGNRLAFRAGPYDRARTLVIDPTLAFSTFLGGSLEDRANAVAVDAAGFIYVAGLTNSVDFPTASPMLTNGGTTDAFVSKLTPDGTSLVYSTYLGGAGGDVALAVAVSASGSAYVAGTTASTDFPLAAPFQTGSGGSSAFVSRFSADGSSLVFSTLLGGANADRVEAIAIDTAGAAYVTGFTSSTDFPLQAAMQTSPGVSFIAKFSAAGALVYSTYFGSKEDPDPDFEFGVHLHAIAVDASGAAYVGGDSLSATIPVTPGAYQRSPSGGQCLHPSLNPNSPYPCHDGVVAKLLPSGALGYATYLGNTAEEANSTDSVNGIAVDAAGFAYAFGTTVSFTFPTTQGALRRGCDDCHGMRIFVTRLNQQGTGLVYSALVGGPGGQNSASGNNEPSMARQFTPLAPGGIALDRLGQAIVTGWTSATDFPLVNAQQPILGSSPLRGTIDAGAHWTPLGNMAGLDPQIVRHAIDGAVYALGGPRGPRPSRLFKSADGGRTWTELNISTLGSVSKLSVDPNNANVLYTEGFKSIDAGASWTALGEVLASAPRPRPGASNVLFAVNLANGIRKSVDGGATWTDSSAGITPQSGLAFTDIEISPSSPNAMYVYRSGFVLYASVDGGASWTARAVPPTGLRQLAVDRALPSTLWATSNVGLYKSTDSGVSWVQNLVGSKTAVAAATATTIYVGNGDSGQNQPVHRSTDAGLSWTLVNQGGASQFSVNPADTANVVAVTRSARDAFVAALAADGSALVYGDYLGGGAADDIAVAVAVAPDGAVVIAGRTESGDFPVSSALQPTNAGGIDAFVAKLRFPQPLVNVDEPAEGSTVFQSFKIGGWAVDRGAASDAGIDGVHIWAYRDGGGAATFIGAPVPFVPRPDVAAWLGPQFGTSGFNTFASGLATGAYTFAIYAHSSVTNTFAPPVLRRIQVASGVLVNIDAPTAGSTTYPGLNIGGWAIDRAAATYNGVESVHVWAYPNPGSGQAPIFLGITSVGGSRPDVGAIFGSRFTPSGFNFAIPALTPGPYLFAVFPYSTVTNSFGAPATVSVQVGDSRPNGWLDAPANDSSVGAPFKVEGWALDAAASSGTGVDVVHVYAFPVGGGQPLFVGQATYGITRTDVGAIFGSRFTPSGFELNASALPFGSYDLRAYAHSPVSGAFNLVGVARVVSH